MATKAHIFDYSPSFLPSSYKENGEIYVLRKEGIQPGVAFFDIDETTRKAVNHEVMEATLSFGDHMVAGKSIRQWLKIGARSSLWYYHKFRLYFDLRNLTYDIRAVEQLSSNYGEVVFHTHRKVFQAISLLPRNVQIQYTPGPKLKNRWGPLVGFALLTAWRFLLSFRQWWWVRRTSYVVINRPANEVPMTMPDNLEIKRENYYYGYILPQLPKDFLVLEEIDHPKPKGDQSYHMSKRLWWPRRKMRQVGTDAILIRRLLRANVRQKAKDHAKTIQETYPLVSAQLTDPFHQLAWWWIQSLHGSSRFYLYKYHAYLLHFLWYPVKKLLIVDEASPPIRLIWDAARAAGAKVVGLQHGTIHSLHMGYRYTAADIKEFNPIPDQTWVWGAHWAEVLQAYGHYPADRLEVVGQARADIIPHLKRVQKAEVISDLDNDRPLMVFASQPQRDPEMRRRAAEDVFKMAMAFPDLQLVLKLHPRETAPAYYHEIAESVGCTNYLIPPQVDLYRLMAVCDGLITCFSTVGAEVVYFNKPLIILDHLKQDVQGYKAAGVAFQAVDAESLTKTVDELLSGKRLLDEAAYGRFQERYAYQGNLPISDYILQKVRQS